MCKLKKLSEVLLDYEYLEEFIDAHNSSYDGTDDPVFTDPPQAKIFGTEHIDIYFMGAYVYTDHRFYLFGFKVKEWITY